MNRSRAKALAFGLPTAASVVLAALTLAPATAATPEGLLVPFVPALSAVTPRTLLPRAEAARPSAQASPCHAVETALARLVEAAADPGRASLEEPIALLRAALSSATEEEVVALLACFRKATDSTLLDAIADALSPDAIARPAVRGALEALADRDPVRDRRAAAILALGHAAPDDALLARLERLAKDSVADARAASANALGEVAERDPRCGRAVTGLLLAVALHDEDEGVRCAALGSLHGRDADASTVSKLAHILVADRDLAPRQAAADALSEVTGPESSAALAALGDALRTERDDEIRKAIAASIVRLGGADAR